MGRGLGFGTHPKDWRSVELIGSQAHLIEIRDFQNRQKSEKIRTESS